MGNGGGIETEAGKSRRDTERQKGVAWREAKIEREKVKISSENGNSKKTIIKKTERKPSNLETFRKKFETELTEKPDNLKQKFNI